MKRLLFSGTSMNSGVAEVGLALLRIATGAGLALAHGINKVPVPEGFVTAVGNLGFPAPEFFAWSAALAELVGGALLAVGLLTRPAALAVAFTMGVAFFLQHANDPFQAKELAFLYMMSALAFAFIGSGRLGLDQLFRRKES